MEPISPSAERIFASAMEIEDGEIRRAYLERACAGDSALRREVDSLLATLGEAGSFMRPGILLEVAPGLLSERPGDRIGRYKLLETIGEGGFGVVWMAEQEEPVRRKVALKIIKLGMDTRQVVARFEAERQALALMEHPNIARVLDGGATETGRPFFVMELVKGPPITEYCDVRRLGLKSRLALVIEVCQAVQHAHQKGVIHRDLKPSNVLVTEVDGRPTPKVIDFGVAKATAQPLTEKTLFTRFQQLVGTPAYMSPEQAGLGSLDVDTRSDVYSLGVLLYELLTGRPPFETRKLLEAGWEGMLRTIREEEPPKPSTRLSTLAAEERARLAAHRGSVPDKLGRLVRGDLDWIVMRCLEKEPRRRYETASGLAADLQRYLRQETVTAAPPSMAYQLGKVFRRHRTAALTTVAFTALLIAASVVSLTQALRANRETQEADRQRLTATHEAARAEAALAESEKAYLEAESNAYANRIALAYQYWRQGNESGARQVLQDCSANERGWEWHHLWKCLHPELWRRQVATKELTVSDWGSLVEPRGSGLRVAFTPDGKLIAVYGNNPFRPSLFDTATGREVFSWSGSADHERMGWATFSSDGRWLIANREGPNRPSYYWVYDTRHPEVPPLEVSGDIRNPGASPEELSAVLADLVSEPSAWRVITMGQPPLVSVLRVPLNLLPGLLPGPTADLGFLVLPHLPESIVGQMRRQLGLRSSDEIEATSHVETGEAAIWLYPLNNATRPHLADADPRSEWEIRWENLWMVLGSPQDLVGEEGYFAQVARVQNKDVLLVGLHSRGVFEERLRAGVAILDLNSLTNLYFKGCDPLEYLGDFALEKTGDALNVFLPLVYLRTEKSRQKPGNVLALRMDPGGSLQDHTIALGGELQDSSSRLLRFRDTVWPQWGVWSVALSPDERLLASSSVDGQLRIWDRQRLFPSEKSEGGVHGFRHPLDGVTLGKTPQGFGSLAFSPDGRFLAGLSFEGELRLWSAEDWPAALSLSFAPSRPRPGGDDQDLRAIQRSDDAFAFQLHDGWIARHLETGTNSVMINLLSGKMAGVQGEVLRFSDNGRYAQLANGDTFETANGVEHPSVQEPTGWRHWSPDLEWQLTRTGEGTFLLTNVIQGVLSHARITDATPEITYRLDPRITISRGAHLMVYPRSETEMILAALDHDSGLVTKIAALPGFVRRTVAVGFLGDDRWLVLYHDQPEPHTVIVDTRDGHHAAEMRGLSLHNLDGLWVSLVDPFVSVLIDTSLCSLDLGDGITDARFVSLARSRFTLPLILRAWSPATGLVELPLREVPVCATMDPDGKRLACSFLDGSLGLFDVRRKKLIAMFEGYGSVVGFLGKGDQMLAMMPDGTLTIYDGSSTEPGTEWARSRLDWARSLRQKLAEAADRAAAANQHEVPPAAPPVSR